MACGEQSAAAGGDVFSQAKDQISPLRDDVVGGGSSAPAAISGIVISCAQGGKQ